MPTLKRSAKPKQAEPGIGPVAGRPHIVGYGIPENKKGLLPWTHVSERMAQAKCYWIATVDPEGRPHATPVDGLWLDGQLYFGGSSQTRRNRNLEANPAVCVHLESGTDVVILHGEAHELHAPERALTVRLAAATREKYGYAPDPDSYGAGGAYVFRPSVAFAWSQFPKDATRWEFPRSP
jgi:nitroimidazol reductase NimA-like FMN-containing flavoprotein (pyridoxamine 5'-phosphate oxidase superfamily)